MQALVSVGASTLRMCAKAYAKLCANLEWRPRLRRFLRLISLPSDSAALFEIVLLRRFLHHCFHMGTETKNPKRITSKAWLCTSGKHDNNGNQEHKLEPDPVEEQQSVVAVEVTSAHRATEAGRGLPASMVLIRVAGSRCEVPLACAFDSFWKYFWA